MRDEPLIRMANQIAGFFEAYPEDEAVQGVATHLKNFWDPRMRADLAALHARRPEALHPLVRKAAGLIDIA